MFQNTRLVMMSATAIQMAAAAMSFVIILILRHQLSLDEFATISISLFPVSYTHLTLPTKA